MGVALERSEDVGGFNSFFFDVGRGVGEKAAGLGLREDGGGGGGVWVRQWRWRKRVVTAEKAEK